MSAKRQRPSAENTRLEYQLVSERAGGLGGSGSIAFSALWRRIGSSGGVALGFPPLMERAASHKCGSPEPSKFSIHLSKRRSMCTFPFICVNNSCADQVLVWYLAFLCFISVHSIRSTPWEDVRDTPPRWFGRVRRKRRVSERSSLLSMILRRALSQPPSRRYPLFRGP